MASRNLKDLHSDLQVLAAQFKTLCLQQDLDILIICTYRDNKEQDALYEQGRSIPGEIVTMARGGQSPHNVVNPDGSPCAKAFDAVPIINGKIDWSGRGDDWKKMLAIAKQLGLDCGVGWGDTDHFQLRNWKDIPIIFS